MTGGCDNYVDDNSLGLVVDDAPLADRMIEVVRRLVERLQWSDRFAAEHSIVMLVALVALIALWNF